VPIVRKANPDIWVYDIPSQALTRLTFDGSNMLPQWTPDGQRVTWRLTEAGGTANLFWKLADGSGASERLTTSEFSQFPGSWSPDGQFLAFNQQSSRASNGRDLWILPLEGERKPQPILQTRFNESAPVFSPDGQWLAYVSDESALNEIYVRPFPKVEEGKWQISTGGGVEPRWAANGRELFYRNQIGDQMMAVNITTEPTFGAGTPRLLFEGSYQRSPGGVAFYDVTPDGQRFLMLQAAEQEAGGSQINVILNWFEELKRLAPTN
jgi:Tol biopolymer transport system component